MGLRAIPARKPELFVLTGSNRENCNWFQVNLAPNLAGPSPFLLECETEFQFEPTGAIQRAQFFQGAIFAPQPCPAGARA